MNRLIIGGLATLANTSGVSAPAGATPPDNDCADPSGSCHEFDWATKYYEAFNRHGLSYVTSREGIPLLEAIDAMCRGEQGNFRDYYVTLTPVEYQKIIEAGSDMCSGVPR